MIAQCNWHVVTCHGVSRFLIERLCNLAAKDIAIPVAIDLYLPALKARLDEAFASGKLTLAEVTKLALSQ